MHWCAPTGPTSLEHNAVEPTGPTSLEHNATEPTAPTILSYRRANRTGQSRAQRCVANCPDQSRASSAVGPTGPTRVELCALRGRRANCPCFSCAPNWFLLMTTSSLFLMEVINAIKSSSLFLMEARIHSATCYLYQC